MLLTSFRCILLPFLLLLILAIPAKAETINISIVSDEWLGFVTKEGKGYYLDVLNRAFPAPDYTIQLTILPYSRALHQVQKDEADIVLGIWANEHPIAQLSHYPVEMDILDAAMRIDHPTITGPKSFNQLRVLSRVGYQVDQLLDQPEQYNEHIDLKKMLKMVASNRADALIDFKSAMQPALDKLIQHNGLENPLTLVENALTEYVFFGFCSLPKCKKLKATFDQAYLKLYLQGAIVDFLLANQQKKEALAPLISATRVLQQ